MRNATLLLLALSCAACSNYSANLPSIKPYKMDIQQGNVVTSKMMLQLRPGMSRAQVRFIMGTPLLVDTFHANRWDYLYRMQKDGKVIEQRHVILEFEGDQLKRVRGDVIPAGSDPAAAIGAAAAESGKSLEPRKLEPKPKAKEKSLMEKLKFWKGDEEEQAAPQTEAQPELLESQPEQPKAAAQPAPVAPASGEAPAAQPEPKPQPTSEEPVKPVTAAPRPAPAPAAREELKTAPTPPEELPPEDDPGYFERMLEKIGF